jgi:hypothetical protein
MGDGHSEKLPGQDSLLAVFWFFITLTVGTAYYFLAGQAPPAQLNEQVNEELVIEPENGLESLPSENNNEE